MGNEGVGRKPSRFWTKIIMYRQIDLKKYDIVAITKTDLDNQREAVASESKHILFWSPLVQTKENFFAKIFNTRCDELSLAVADGTGLAVDEWYEENEYEKK